MSDRLLDNLLITVIGGVLVAIITIPLTVIVTVWVDFSKPIHIVLWALTVVFLIGLALLFTRYLRVISGAAREARSFERKRFLDFRRHLEAGGTASTIYAGQLARLLATVDRYLRDAHLPASPHQRRRLFGLQTEAPLWSAPAYDKCLLLALIYPMGAAFLIWVISGQAGSLEQALQLQADVNPIRRAAELLITVFFLFTFFRARRAQSIQKALLWGFFCVGGVVGVDPTLV